MVVVYTYGQEEVTAPLQVRLEVLGVAQSGGGGAPTAAAPALPVVPMFFKAERDSQRRTPS